jgi:hypothetical protein
LIYGDRHLRKYRVRAALPPPPPASSEGPAATTTDTNGTWHLTSTRPN